MLVESALRLTYRELDIYQNVDEEVMGSRVSLGLSRGGKGESVGGREKAALTSRYS